MKSLHTLLDDISYDALPPAWNTFNLADFSKSKTLWDYQQNALQQAIKSLWKFYADFEADKNRFFNWYADNDIDLAPLNLSKKKENVRLLEPYYSIEGETATYQNFINRIGFWMATGSGKTLVLVKLLEILWKLMQLKVIPNREILVLTHREDLLQQLIEHVKDFNSTGNPPHIILKELKEFPHVKRGDTRLFSESELTIFYYRSDNFSDEQKDKIIDFHIYDNNGEWFVLLDEAHKGDKDDSKRQHIYSILSRNGFLFNFSATFTDAHEICTTAFEFNLASFIQRGYGKHICLLKQENRAFSDKEDYSNEEKQRIVLQSLLMFTYIAKSRQLLCAEATNPLFHKPLLVALVNSVNTEDADLKLFFREVFRIGKGGISSQAFTAAKSTLKNELIASPELLYEDTNFILNEDIFDRLTYTDVLNFVYNAASPGDLEVLVRPTNEKELAFKLHTTETPFALIKIEKTSEWLKKELAECQVVKGFEDDSFFEKLNQDDSEINVLMGSRSFYEGWDSNRPNVITFINIGTSDDAQKFVLQSVGRGVRIEPKPGKRKRLESLHNNKEISDEIFNAASPYLAAIQTLMIFGTKREALSTIFEGLKHEKDTQDGEEIPLTENVAAIDDHPLFIPKYRLKDGHLLIEQHEPKKFELQKNELELLDGYVKYLDDDRLLLARHDMNPKQIGILHKTLEEPEQYFQQDTKKKFGNINILVPRLNQYFGLVPKEHAGFKPLEDEINHFKHIRVILEDIQPLVEKIESVKKYAERCAEKESTVNTLKQQVRDGTLDIDQYTIKIQELPKLEPIEFFDHDAKRLHIKYIAEHYYIPLLLQNDDSKFDFIRRVISVESEIKFVNALEAYLKEDNHLFKEYDWWLFSRAEETLDKIVIPYYDPTKNKIWDFHPDFIFWLAKGNTYTILYVDPKGMSMTDYQFKIDGYEELFREKETGKYRIFEHQGYKVKVALAMYNNNAGPAPQKYRDYWYDTPKTILTKLNSGKNA